MPTPMLEALAMRLQRHECSIGDVVVRQGDRGDTFFVVESGTFTAAVDGGEAVRLGPGDSFGEATLLLHGVRTATITAHTPAVVWSLEGTHFVAALRCGDGRTLTNADGVIRADVQHAAPAPTSPRDAPDAADSAARLHLEQGDNGSRRQLAGVPPTGPDQSGSRTSLEYETVKGGTWRVAGSRTTGPSSRLKAGDAHACEPAQPLGWRRWALTGRGRRGAGLRGG